MTRRHPWVDRTCAMLAPIVHGQDAQVALDDLEIRRAAGEDLSTLGLAVLPVWAWMPARINVGRKDLDPRDTAGPRLLMNVRLDYAGGSVHLVNASTVTTIAYRGIGLGHEYQGEVEISTLGRDADLPDGRLAPESAWRPERYGYHAIRSALHRYVREGKEYYWSHMLQMLESRLQHALAQAHDVVRYDVSGMSALDEVGLELVSTRLTVGDIDSDLAPARAGSKPRLQRLIDRCLAPEAFRVVDVEKFIIGELRRSALDGVRDYLGDPRVGRRIRGVAEELRAQGRLTSIEDVVAECRVRFPKETIGPKRVVDALTLGSDVNADTISLDVERAGRAA